MLNMGDYCVDSDQPVKANEWFTFEMVQNCYNNDIVEVCEFNVMIDGKNFSNFVDFKDQPDIYDVESFIGLTYEELHDIPASGNYKNFQLNV